MTDLVTETSPSARFRRYLKVPGRTRVEPDYYIPYWRLEGQGPGPTLLVLGGVHGNEFEGPLALYELLQELPEKEFVGTVIVVPWTNLPAVEACRRETPLDGKNLARCFPGSPEGTFTERLAYSVGQELIRGADFLLDLHSAGDAYTSPPLVGYYRAPGEAGERAAAAARRFGLPVVWEHPTIAPGRTLSLAAEWGIPALYTEAPGGQRVRAEDVAAYKRGVYCLMDFLGMMAAEPPPAPQVFLRGDGDTDGMPTFRRGGLFRSFVQVLDRVEEGHVLGQVLSLDGDVVETVRAQQAGRVVFLRATPTVQSGDRVALIAPEMD